MTHLQFSAIHCLIGCLLIETAGIGDTPDSTQPSRIAILELYQDGTAPQPLLSYREQIERLLRESGHTVLSRAETAEKVAASEFLSGQHRLFATAADIDWQLSRQALLQGESRRALRYLKRALSSIERVAPTDAFVERIVAIKISMADLLMDLRRHQESANLIREALVLRPRLRPSTLQHPPPFISQVEKVRADLLRQQPATLVLNPPQPNPQLVVDGRVRAPPCRLPPGAHLIRVTTAAGQTAMARVTLLPGESYPVTVALTAIDDFQPLGLMLAKGKSPSPLLVSEFMKAISPTLDVDRMILVGIIDGELLMVDSVATQWMRIGIASADTPRMIAQALGIDAGGKRRKTLWWIIGGGAAAAAATGLLLMATSGSGVSIQ